MAIALEIIRSTGGPAHRSLLKNVERTMLAIPRRYSHFIFGIIQSGLTSFVASGIATLRGMQDSHLMWNWICSWLIAWVTMSPIVLLAAPLVRSLSLSLTRDIPDFETGSVEDGDAQDRVPPKL